MDLSFREKSLWLMAASLVAAFGWYSAGVLPAGADDVAPRQIVAFAAAVFVLIVCQIVGHIAIAIADRHTGEDERDRLIALVGARNGGIVLAAGAFFSLCAALVTSGNFAFVHVLLAFWVTAELVSIGSQLVLHRRGV